MALTDTGHRVFTALATAVATVLCVPAVSAGEAPTAVVIITVDTLRADRLSSYGYSRATSPNIDQLLSEGTRFSRAWTVEPLTNPALCSMITSTAWSVG